MTRFRRYINIIILLFKYNLYEVAYLSLLRFSATFWHSDWSTNQTSVLSSLFKARLLSQATVAVMASTCMGTIFGKISVDCEDDTSSPTALKHLE